jgi:hypothetical protein
VGYAKLNGCLVTTFYQIRSFLSQEVIPFHEKPDTDVNPESFAVSKFFNCVKPTYGIAALRAGREHRCELVLHPPKPIVLLLDIL